MGGLNLTSHEVYLISPDGGDATRSVEIAPGAIDWLIDTLWIICFRGKYFYISGFLSHRGMHSVCSFVSCYKFHAQVIKCKTHSAAPM
jgi:hypothetical protein